MQINKSRYALMGTLELDDAESLYRHFLPYIICRDSDGTYIFLNREYKPAGLVSQSGDWVDYATCTQRFHVRGLTPEIAARISVKGDPDTGWITLYHDGCRPQDSDKHRRALLKRLKLFFDLVEVENLSSTRAPRPLTIAPAQTAMDQYLPCGARSEFPLAG